MDILQIIRSNHIVFIITSLISVPFFILAYFLGYRRKRLSLVCTEKTRGRVVRYSTIKYNDINLPIVAYEVDGENYEVTGPKFKAIVEITGSIFSRKDGANSNLDSIEGDFLPQVLKIDYRNWKGTHPIYARYPVDKEVDVFYNPMKASEAYVERPLIPNMFLSFWLFIILALLINIVPLAILVWIKSN